MSFFAEVRSRLDRLNRADTDWITETEERVRKGRLSKVVGRVGRGVASEVTISDFGPAPDAAVDAVRASATLVTVATMDRLMIFVYSDLSVR